MALEVLTRTNAVYQEASRTVQKQTDIEPITDLNNSELIVTEMQPIGDAKGHQNETTDNSEQKQDAQWIKSSIDHANETMKSKRTKFEFKYHEEINRVSIKILDKETQEVIREIPPEDTMKMVEKIWEIAGLIVDEKR